MDAVMQVVRHTLRRLMRSPGFALVAVVSLALGIGANTAVFSLVNAAFFKDPGIEEPERVVQLYRQGQHPYWSITWGQYRAMRDEADDVFSDLATFRFNGVRVGEADELVSAFLVTGDYFGAIGVEPDRGRSFVPGQETDVESPSTAVILSHDFWTHRFGADPSVVGSEIRVDGAPHTVVGVLPESFAAQASGIGLDVYLPDPGAVRSPGSDMVMGIGRLEPGVSVAQARGALAGIAASLNEGRPAELRPIAFTVVPQTEIALHPWLDQTVTPMATLLFGVVALVLLIACTNVASFLLARAADRRREFAVRRAMGAGTGRITGELLSEALVLAVAGGVAGVALAQGALALLFRVDVPVPLEVRADFGLDWRVLLFSAGVASLAALLAGLFPAFRARKDEVAAVLKDEATAVTEGGRRVGVRGALVTVQVAMSLVLLLVAGLFLRSLMRATDIDPGFEPEGVALVTVVPEGSGYGEEEGRLLYEDLLRRAQALPDVETAALGTRIPLQPGNRRRGFRRPDVAPPPGREWHYHEIVYVTPEYFDLLGMEMLQGQAFSPGGEAPEVIVNESAVREIWSEGTNVVGRTLLTPGGGGEAEELRIAGVVRNSKVHTLGETTEGVAYLPIRRYYQGTALLLARGQGPAEQLAPRLRAAAKDADADLFVHGDMSARKSMSLALFLPRMGALLLAVMGGLALLMAAIGLYGVVGYAVARRRKEMGIRMVLGAKAANVVRLLTVGGVRLVVLGLVAGFFAALFVGRLMEGFLYGVSGTDPVTFVLIPLVLLGVGALAAWLPARRIASVDPAETLRTE